jgi:SAM-dependent methyltransferase
MILNVINIYLLEPISKQLLALTNRAPHYTKILTALTYPDDSFDLCMSFQDLEHIPDYQFTINELYLVTKHSGHALLSTPFIVGNQFTLTRVTIDSVGSIKHLLELEYHGDLVITQGILCYYHLRWELLDAFKKAGVLL